MKNKTELSKLLGVPEEYITPDVESFFMHCKSATKLYALKNHDYGNSFEKGMDTIGTAYGVGRIYDKVNRLITLTKQEAAVKDESITDTVNDLACYSIMLNCYWSKHPLQNKQDK